MPNTILLKGHRGHHDEAYAVAALSPGHWLIKDSTGKVKKNDTATGADIHLMIAKEDSLQGKTILDAYAANNVVMFYEPQPGDLVYCRIPANAAALVIGDRMQVDATGCAIKLAAGKPKLQAEEAIDNSAGGAEAFIRARVL